MMMVSCPATLFALLLLLTQPKPLEASMLSCTETLECETALGVGSVCKNDLCTNTFYNGGCLKNLLPNWNKTRVCNSQDPPEAEAMGFCRPSPLDYTEVRFGAFDWESADYISWLMQILLSEVLDVPTSIESGVPDLNLNFYDEASGFDIGDINMSYSMTEVEIAAEIGDCVPVTNTKDPEEYEKCAHVFSEVWVVDFPVGFQVEGAEPFNELGLMGEGATFIPLFAAERDPTLTTYTGLQGEKNRRKLAETFKRPTRWGQFCREVSPTNCAHPDPVSKRPPQTEEEENSFFVDGLFYGHFRYTEESDCDKYPTNCTGFFVDHPCGWTTFAQPQAYHMNIAFAFEGPEENGGFSYEEQVAIWLAANATKSAVIMQWWFPEPLHQSFIGTDAEMTRVAFPTETQECVDNRADFREMCNPDATFAERAGNPAGICDYSPQALQKTLSLGLSMISEDPDVDEAFWSPAHAAVSKFKISNVQLDRIFEYWSRRDTDKWNFDPRAAVCQWFSENLDILEAFVPKSHPRVIEEVDSSGEPIFVAALAVAVFAAVLVTTSMVMTFVKRKTKVMYYAQTEFLFLIQFGMLLTIGGAFTYAVSPSSGICGLTIWLTNLGYVFQLIPLWIRISEINLLAASGKHMERARLNITTLYARVAIVATVVATFLLVWTLLDPPQEQFEYDMTDRQTPEGEHIVTAHDYCGSEDAFWYYIQIAWRAAVLLPACMIAFLALRIKEDMNDTKTLSAVLFIRLLFLVILLCTELVAQAANAMSDFMGYRSILLSVDTILSVTVYVLPKFWASGENLKADPLPDVFVHTTIALLDVVGFTAWSSVREPIAVFQFLEKLYQNFDNLAEDNGVYKVETVRESYVAATGIPHPQQNNAVLMARFASQCMKKMPKYLRQLEIQFGPDTSDMSLRVGMHSGPVTGGFLKGKGSRFQVFGDTVTTANLISAHSTAGGVHLSEATANLLTEAGKRRWLVEREDKVDTVEKGELKTYWLVKGGLRGGLQQDDLSVYPESSMGGGDSDVDGDWGDELESQQRWIEWNVEVFKGLLKQIVARRATPPRTPCKFIAPEGVAATMPLEEVKEIIALPKFDKRAARRQRDNADAEVPEIVVQQMRQYVAEIADLYNNENPFHNFSHASYVVMAISKYMNRIMAGSEVDLGDNEERQRSSVQAALHDHTYGITSDPLTHFACAFSALIHDVDHPGVPNATLIKEDEAVALKYQERSVAEQKSLDIGLDLLNETRFEALRGAICSTPSEVERFRQLVINQVMATDLGDKELKEMRNGRWDKAFAKDTTASDFTASSTEETCSEEESRQPRDSRTLSVNRKATIVIEHLIQAADVAHMSQHWSIYRKWNERLFRELYKSYREGRTASSPADGWYKGEIGFFDFYIIPLTKKIRDCGVFGPTSDENYNYATNNRNMWLKEGDAITKDMLARVEKEYNEMQCMPVDKALEIVEECAPERDESLAMTDDISV